MDGHLDEDQVLITGLEVDGRPVGIGDKINGQTVLAEGISYTSSITLNNEIVTLFYLLIIFLMQRNNRSTITAYYHIRRIGWFLMMERRLLI